MTSSNQRQALLCVFPFVVKDDAGTVRVLFDDTGVHYYSANENEIFQVLPDGTFKTFANATPDQPIIDANAGAVEFGQVSIYPVSGTVRAGNYEDLAGNQVVGLQQDAIGNPADSTNPNLYATIVVILDTMRAHGLIAT